MFALALRCAVSSLEPLGYPLGVSVIPSGVSMRVEPSRTAGYSQSCLNRQLFSLIDGRARLFFVELPKNP